MKYKANDMKRSKMKVNNKNKNIMDLLEECEAHRSVRRFRGRTHSRVLELHDVEQEHRPTKCPILRICMLQFLLHPVQQQASSESVVFEFTTVASFQKTTEWKSHTAVV
jgi:hypothetical protein